MKLSQLIKDNKEGKTSETIYGIEVDTYCSDTLEGVTELGFVFQMNDEGTYLSDDLLDVILDYQYKNTTTLLEIPFGTKVEPATLHYCGNTTGASISLLPPASGSEEDIRAYTQMLCEMTKHWINSPNTEYLLYPSNGYFEYLVKEALGIKSEVISTDEYMNDSFVKPLTIEQMDSIKEELKAVFINIFGDEDGFKEYAHSVALGVAEATSELCDDILSQMKEEELKESQNKEVSESEEPQTDTDTIDSEKG